MQRERVRQVLGQTAEKGLPVSQFKNVVFEFVPASHAPSTTSTSEGVADTEEGVFEVHACFMGVKLEHVEIDVQELLQLQYEGCAVMNLFGKARINVNLLLHFLNVKFYGRK